MKNKIFLTVLSIFIYLNIFSQHDKQFQFYLNKADSLYKNHDLKSAILNYESAYKIVNKSDTLALRLLNSYANCLIDYGRLDKAIELFEEGYRLSEKLENVDYKIKISNNLSVVYSYVYKYHKAIEYAKNSIELCILMPDNIAEKYNLLAIRYNNLALAYAKKSEDEMAIENYDKSIYYSKKTNNNKNLASSYLGVCGVLSNKDFKGAVFNCKKALEIATNMSFDIIMADTYNNLGYLYEGFGDLDSAKYYFLQSAEINEKINRKYDLAIDYLNLTHVYISKQEYDESLRLIEKISEINKDINNEQIGMRATFFKSIIYIDTGRFTDAKSSINNILYNVKKHELTHLFPAVYSSLGEIHFGLDEPDSAIFYQKKALYYNRLINNGIDEIPNLAFISKLYLSKDDFVNAKKFYNLSIIKADSIWATIPTHVRNDFSHTIGIINSELLDIFTKKSNWEEAFWQSEHYNARNLSEQIAQKEKNIKLSPKENINFSEGSKVCIKYITNKHNIVVIQLRDTSFVGYYFNDTILSTTINIELDSIISNKFLSSRSIEPISFYQSDSGNYNQDSKIMRFFRYYQNIISQNISIDNKDKLISISKILYKVIFNKLLDLENSNDIYLLPESYLWQLPFETLIMPDGRYLCEKYTIRYAQSLSVLNLLKQRREQRDKNKKDRHEKVLAVGGAIYNQKNYDSVMTASDLRVLKNYCRNSLKNGEKLNQYYQKTGYAPSNLPGTLEEVREISKIYDDCDTLTGEQANEKTIKGMSAYGKLAEYDIVHFATHGLSHQEIPELSALVLSLNDTTQEDGYLRMEEIADLKFNARFANLSACETGLGKIYNGEGMVGLTHAFLLAGCDGTCVSLWQVDDKATKTFMTTMYSIAKEQEAPFYEAITLTKRKFINGDFGEEYKKPYYWSAFVYYGI
jgi:CHAT domain-containing protein